jgi:hypothetical protein
MKTGNFKKGNMMDLKVENMRTTINVWNPAERMLCAYHPLWAQEKTENSEIMWGAKMRISLHYHPSDYAMTVSTVWKLANERRHRRNSDQPTAINWDWHNKFESTQWLWKTFSLVHGTYLLTIERLLTVRWTFSFIS